MEDKPQWQLNMRLGGIPERGTGHLHSRLGEVPEESKIDEKSLQSQNLFMSTSG